MQFIFGFLGRFFISIIFVISAVGKLFFWEQTHQELVTHLSDWMAYANQMPNVQKAIDFLLPLTPILLVIATVFEGLGGALVLLGIKPKMGAILLILFIIPVTLVFHAFWMEPPPARTLQTVMFLKNLAILGGLFLLLKSTSGAKAKAAE